MLPRFRNTKGEKFTLEEVVVRTSSIIQEKPNETWNLCVGTDSQKIKNRTIYVTAIVLHQVGKGANFFYRKQTVKGRGSLFERLTKETHESIEIMRNLDRTDIPYLVNEFEIHIDAGTGGASREIMKACSAYAIGMGFNAKLKPDAVAASYTADRFTK